MADTRLVLRSIWLRHVDVWMEMTVQFHAPTVLQLAKPPLLRRATVRLLFPGHVFFDPNLFSQTGCDCLLFFKRLYVLMVLRMKKRCLFNSSVVVKFLLFLSDQKMRFYCLTFGISRQTHARKFWTTGNRWKTNLKNVSFYISYSWNLEICKRWYGLLFNKTDCLCSVVRDSSVDVTTHYRFEGPGIESRRMRYFPHPSRPALESTHPPVQLVPGQSRVKRQGRGFGPSPI